MSAQPDIELTSEFLHAFEEVFDNDWAFTKEMLCIRDQTAEEKELDKSSGLEVIPIIAEDGTFVQPKVTDEVAHWGNRGRLLAAYRALKKVLS